MAAVAATSNTKIVAKVKRPAATPDGELSAARPTPMIATAVSKLAIENRIPKFYRSPYVAGCKFSSVKRPPWAAGKVGTPNLGRLLFDVARGR
jgi:hypothetical protein